MKNLNFDEVVANDTVKTTNTRTTVNDNESNIEFIETQSVGSWCEQHGGSVKDLKYATQKNNPEKIFFSFNGTTIAASSKLNPQRRALISKCRNKDTDEVFFMIHNESDRLQSVDSLFTF